MRFLKSPFLWIPVVVVVLYAAAAASILCRFGVSQEAGWFGDLFGGINGFFTALAAGAAIYALRMQQKEIEARTESLQQGQQELQQQTRLLADQLTELTGPTHPMVDALASDEITQKLFDHAQEALLNEIRAEYADPKRQARLQEAFAAFIPVAKGYIEAHSNMFHSLYHNPNATHATAGTIKSTARRTEEIAREMGEWVKNIRENRELNA